MFALRCIRKGESIVDLSEESVLPSPTRKSLQIGDSMHVENEVVNFLNHSCIRLFGKRCGHRFDGAISRTLFLFLSEPSKRLLGMPADFSRRTSE